MKKAYQVFQYSASYFGAISGRVSFFSIVPQYLALYVNGTVNVNNHNWFRTLLESLLILEYIDETWKTGPRILPQEPYERAIIRFWANYFVQHLLPSTAKLWKSTGEEQEKAQEEVLEKIRFVEEGIPEIQGNELGLLQILLVTTFGSHKAYEDVLGVKILVRENTPLLYLCVTSLNDLPAVKEICPPHDKLVSLLKIYWQIALESTTD
uniref:Glutathione S-transferase n=1 Tax=Nicotiana sylvestris TaxID=4096 RepID=A0A1U7VLP6_NICSY|nr:PREDICTED: glutathione S-transferase U9-like [Nicotiana sylvestris]